ncbi:MAG: sulfatase [Lentisphaerae bacterium]|jgi:arylsulfatase A-like enzyme|nr:sulfatase [Lentisphaerota bacterium]MBT4822166.1 sulfatase [Lentisphaerota bacterium]MBT5612449.1 sulfatase [Lentisphaerota bacterium]MBT7057155.1 sulfatase [Lentisphaerota bacterium]MBT7848029.1 sulfatase [Lentisphaerota bacterium]
MNTFRRTTLQLALLLTCGNLLPQALGAERPNVVFILADDLGYGGLKCYGTDWLETPNLDRLCSEGMKFTNGYASHPTCQPSRIAILSGQYAPRTGGYRVMDHHRGKEHLIKYVVPKLTGLALEKTTFAERFRQAGYTTAMYGKWHAGNYNKSLHPRYQGFDEAYVCKSHYDVKRSDPHVDLPEGMDFSEYYTGLAIAFMEDANETGKSFFLYMPYYLIHAPFETRQDYIDYFRKKLEGRAFPDRNAERIPIVAAMTKHLDDCVGRLLDALKTMGIEENTIVVFTSDNGAYTPALTGGFRGQKGHVYEGGMRVPYIFKWPGRIKPRSESTERITHIDLYPTFLDLAGVSHPDDHVLDGESLAGLLTGKLDRLPERPICCYHPKYGQYHPKKKRWVYPWRNVIYDGNYKLREVVEYGTYELYNLEDDPKEAHDLTKGHPERAQQLIKKLRRWERDTGAPPLTLNPDYAPKK